MLSLVLNHQNSYAMLGLPSHVIDETELPPVTLDTAFEQFTPHSNQDFIKQLSAFISPHHTKKLLTAIALPVNTTHHIFSTKPSLLKKRTYTQLPTDIKHLQIDASIGQSNTRYIATHQTVIKQIQTILSTLPLTIICITCQSQALISISQPISQPRSLLAFTAQHIQHLIWHDQTITHYQTHPFSKTNIDNIIQSTTTQPNHLLITGTIPEHQTINPDWQILTPPHSQSPEWTPCWGLLNGASQ